jgi:hypothetical protein
MVGGFLRKIGAWEPYSGFITAVATAVIAAFTIELYSVSNRQGETMQRQLELSERPWIGEEIALASPLTFDDKLGKMDVTITLKGFGNSPAVNVHPFCKLSALKYQNRAIATFEDNTCGKLGEQTEQDPRAGDMLFPAETHIEVNGVAVSQVEIAEAIKFNSAVMKFDMGGLFAPLLVCCVDYRFAFSKVHHQTRRTYFMGIPIGPSSPGAWRNIKPEGVVNGAVLMPAFQGNSAN